MSDDLETPDAFEEREHEFALGQGITEVDYAQLLELAVAHAQATLPLLGAAPWRYVGPRNLGGRIIALEQDPTDARVIYAGSAQGGLWRSRDAGDTWERLGDSTHVFPVGAIAVPPKAPNVIYFGTGALFPQHTSGRGLFRATVAATGVPTIERLVAPDSPILPPTQATPGAALRYTRIRVDPDDPARFWAASQTGLWRCECPLAVPAVPRFTRDLPNRANEPAGAAVASVPGGFGNWPSHCTDLLVARDPREQDTVRVNDAEVARYLILFVAVDGVGIYRGRFDRAATPPTVQFESDPLKLPTGVMVFDRVRLAQCERQPQHVYAVMADTAGNVASEVFHSSNSGKDWTIGAQRISAVGARANQANYDLVLEVAPDDPQVVVMGAVELCLSNNFGRTWTKILDMQRSVQGDAAQHEDQHAALFDRGNHRRLWVGNDGGLALATDLRLPPQAIGYWRRRSHGIYAGQCQDVTVNPALPFMCGIGLQDNGTWLSLGGPTWYQLLTGDGGALAFHLANPRQVAVTAQTGVFRSDAVAFDQPPPPAPPVTFDLVALAAGDLPDAVARGHRLRRRVQLVQTGLVTGPFFIGVVEQHPTVAQQLLAGRLADAYSSVNFGTAWTPIAGAPIVPGGDVTAVAFGPPDAHNPAPANVDGWVGTSAGTLFFTRNAPAAGWAALGTPLPFPGGPAAGLRISEIAIHPLDRRIVAVSATGIQGRVFVTFNQGRTWLDVTEPTPTSLVVHPVGASIQVGQQRAFTAIATYPGIGVVNVTARATWTSSNPFQARVVSATQALGMLTGFGREGVVTGLSAGPPTTITATLLAGVPNGSASQPVTVTAAAVPAVPFVPQPRSIVAGSLPPGPVSSVIFDPAPGAGVATTLLAGTLVGVFALPGVPVVDTLDILPHGPLTFQTGAPAFQPRCVATFTDGTQVDATRDVDWSTNAPGAVNVSNAAGSPGRLTFGAAGVATIRVDRGGRNATLAVTVQAAAAPPPPALGPAPAAVDPTLPVAWATFNSNLPHVLVTDFERVGTTNAIRAATYGLGVFECVTAGGPRQRLYIRQTIIEDGRTYPRPSPPAIPDDPRLAAGTVALDFTHAFDIRVDASPFTFFDDVVDGVEFDEQLEVDDPVPTEDNYVYVQVHNAGTTAVPNVNVHLYAAVCAPGDVVNPIGPVATNSPASLEAGAPIADFYGRPNLDPIPTSRWRRVDVVRLLDEVAPDAPRVARFTWTPDATLATRHVALLALCSGAPSSLEELPAAPAAATLAAFIIAERRAALRIVRVAPRPPASLFVRDGIADDTRIGGYPVGGRSPEIMVVRPDIGGTPADAFKDFTARRATDTVSATGINVVYVRVHNRRRFETQAQVKVFAIGLDETNAPRAQATWTELPPGAAAFANVTVPPSGVGYARVEFPTVADPNPGGTTSKSYLLLALVKSQDDTDRLPDLSRVTSADVFWDLVSRYVDADNAAARAVPWVP
jgi:hypothetical protein